MKFKPALMSSTVAGLMWSMTAGADLDPDRVDVLTQESLGFGVQNDAQFGYSLTAAGYSLIIGAPRRMVRDVRAGAVYQVLATAGNQNLSEGDASEWSQASQPFDGNRDWVRGAPEEGDRFGHALAAGRPNRNNSNCQPNIELQCWKVLVGVPGEDLGKKNNAGMVNVLLQFKAQNMMQGGDTAPLDRIHQGVIGILGKAESGDGFGRALAVGDFNGDGGDDVAIGAPYEDVGKYDDAGGINVIMGDPAHAADFQAEGFTIFNNTLWSQQNLEGQREKSEHFGSALATGDFNGDGVTDLAVGIPDELIKAKGEDPRGGAVQIIFGEKFEQTVVNEGGLTLQGNELISQNSKGVSGGSETGDRFGAALATGDFNGDGIDDLAVGVPGESIGDVGGAGMVHVMYGNRGRWDNPNFGGLKTMDGVTQIALHQKTAGVPGAVEAGDNFGAALAAGDLNADGIDDLIVGIPGEDLKVGEVNHRDAGGVTVFYGSSTGIKADNNRWLDQRRLSGGAVANMRFGHSLAVGDFDRSGRQDLAIGSNSHRSRIRPGRPVDDVPGTVTVFYQR